MKNYTITEEQIKELAKRNAKVKKWFPEVFETKLEVGKVITYPDYKSWLLFITEVDNENRKVKGYGFGADGKWMENALNDYWDFEELEKSVLATEEGVLEALKNEAVKRGFKKGVYIEDIYNGNDFEIVSSNNFHYEEVPFGKYAGKMALRDKTGNILFVDGKWAEIIETITKKEAEKKLNVKIID